MKKLFQASSALFSAIPGLTIIWKGIGTPPGHAILFGGVIEALGVFSLIVLLVNKRKLKRLAGRKVTKIAIILMGVCFVSIVVYIILLDFCVITHPTHGTAYFPLWTSGEIAAKVARAGGRYAALDRYGNYSVVDSINKMPRI